MFKYLYKYQVKKFIMFIIFSMLSCLFEIGSAYIMLKCVDLSLERNLSDALKAAKIAGLDISEVHQALDLMNEEKQNE